MTVNLDDGFFSWDFVTTYEYEGVTMYMLNMTSQKWLDGIYELNFKIVAAVKLYKKIVYG